jgi:hypothetical protein
MNKQDLLFKKLIDDIDQLIELADRINTRTYALIDEIDKQTAKQISDDLTKEGKLP